MEEKIKVEDFLKDIKAVVKLTLTVDEAKILTSTLANLINGPRGFFLRETEYAYFKILSAIDIQMHKYGPCDEELRGLHCHSKENLEVFKLEFAEEIKKDKNKLDI